MAQTILGKSWIHLLIGLIDPSCSNLKNLFWFRFVFLLTKDLIEGDVVEGKYDLVDGNNEVAQGQLHLSVQYVSNDIIMETETGKILPRAYFPARENNRLVLYQDVDTQPMIQVSIVLLAFH